MLFLHIMWINMIKKFFINMKIIASLRILNSN